MPRGRNLILPVALIVIGILVLLANVGVLSSAAVQRLGDLWPLLLVILGIWLILNHTLPRGQATPAGLAVTAVIVIAAVAYAVLAPATALGGTQHAYSAQRLTGVSAATLELDYGASTIQIGTANVGDNLYAAHVDYPSGENPPSITLDQSTATVSISDNGRFNGLGLFGSGQRKLVIDLSTTVPWTIRVGGGASNLQVRVPQLQVTNLEISGGASNLVAELGPPKGTVGVHVTGGASNASLRVPSGSQWSVNLTGGVSSLTIDGQSSGGLGDFSKQSAGYTGASDRFDIQVSGGVSHLDLRTS